MDKEIFISHRNSDKIFVDLLETFLTTCGIESETIFCSSLPGNGVQCEISKEIKAALRTSKLNIVLLSDGYYQSAYCQNEAGIIWYSDTEKTVFALPEIDKFNMEGFLNSEYIIRRMDSKHDILTFSDKLKEIFPRFKPTAANLNAKIDKLIEQYKEALCSREPVNPPIVPKEVNDLDREIQAGGFSDAEKIILLYFYETQKLNVDASLLPLSSWMSEQNASGVDVESGFETLKEDGLLTSYTDEFGNFEYKLSMSTYRHLLKITQPSVEILRSALQIKSDIANECDNEIDDLIKEGFSQEEILLLKYIMDLRLDTLFAGWQEYKEINMIKNWEEVNKLNTSPLSQEYSDLLNKLIIRKLVEVEEVTREGNPKKYRLAPVFTESLESLSPESKKTIYQTVRIYQAMKEELPF